jgi:hypothetical protein
MLHRVLAKHNVRKMAVDEAARFLVYKFQEGVVHEDDLTLALETHLKSRSSWNGIVENRAESRRKRIG